MFNQDFNVKAENEQIVDPTITGMTGAPLGFGGVYLMAFDVGALVKNDKGTGRRTTGGAMYDHNTYGTFKAYAIKKEAKGPWLNIAYGPDLNEAYGAEIGALFVTISNDYNSFYDQLKDALDTFDANLGGENIPVQVWVKVQIPNIKGAIIKQEYRGKVQFKHRVMLIGDPVILPMTDPRVVKSLNDEGVIFDVTQLMDSWPTKQAETKIIRAANINSMEVMSRAAKAAREAVLNKQPEKAKPKDIRTAAADRAKVQGGLTRTDFGIPTPGLKPESDEE
jgi:hypothetical protein